MSDAVLQLENLTKTFGSARGVSDINLTVNKGEVFGFIGPNGAGKSTTIRMILDFIRPSSGSISVLGMRSKQDAVAIHKRVGYISGDMALDNRLTGKQYLEYTANLHDDIPWSTIQKLTTRLQCEPHKKIGSLSRGNRQKIALVGALMHNPDLLILDEPTSGLDPLMQAEFAKLIAEHTAQGKTAFISSHVLSEVQELCDRVGFIKEGKLLSVRSLDELLAESHRTVTVTFSGAVPANILKGLPGITNSKAHGKVLTFSINGDFTTLLKRLSAHSIKDLLVVEPNLEELFMGMYEDSQPKETNNV